MNQVIWRYSSNPVPYLEAIKFMEKRVSQIHLGTEKQMLWALEHLPLYTKGTSAKDSDLLDLKRFPVFNSGRGGEFTYHGPKQRVLYIMLDLKKWKKDIRAYISALEDVIIETLKYFNIKGERRDGRIGIWVKTNNTEKK